MIETRNCVILFKKFIIENDKEAVIRRKKKSTLTIIIGFTGLIMT